MSLIEFSGFQPSLGWPRDNQNGRMKPTGYLCLADSLIQSSNKLRTRQLFGLCLGLFLLNDAPGHKSDIISCNTKLAIPHRFRSIGIRSNKI